MLWPFSSHYLWIKWINHYNSRVPKNIFRSKSLFFFSYHCRLLCIIYTCALELSWQTLKMAQGVVLLPLVVVTHRRQAEVITTSGLYWAELCCWCVLTASFHWYWNEHEGRDWGEQNLASQTKTAKGRLVLMFVLKPSQKYDFMQFAALCAGVPLQRWREGVCWVCVVLKPSHCHTGDQVVWSCCFSSRVWPPCG